MTLLNDYLKDLEPLVNLDCGTANRAGVTRAAEIMKGYFESIGFVCELVDLGPSVGKGLLCRNKPDAYGRSNYPCFFCALHTLHALRHTQQRKHCGYCCKRSCKCICGDCIPVVER